jgi:hypothetical protein
MPALDASQDLKAIPTLWDAAPTGLHSEEPEWEHQNKFGSVSRHKRTMGGDQNDSKFAT